jgi:SulP family sulfate permease
LLPDALTIALLAGIESLLSAVIGDGLSGGRHKSNCELMAQGIANLGSVIFGGIPATGAIARTATNVKSGAQTPIAGIIHAVTLFLIMICFAPLVSRIPLPALAAVLIMVAWNMSEIHHVRLLFKAPAADIIVLLTAFLLTVFIDITVAVEVGVVIAAFLFIKRMGDFSKIVPIAKILKEEEDSDVLHNPPPGVEVYEIHGPFFFGAADRLKDVLHDIAFPPKVFILRMRHVPVIDASGLHALKEFYQKCSRDCTVLMLSEVNEGVHKALYSYGLHILIGNENIVSNLSRALQRARVVTEKEVAKGF